MSTEKKEKEKSNKILNKNDQKKFKTLISVLEIISHIGEILILIGIGFLATLMIAVPVIIKNVKVEDDNITIFNEQYKYNVNASGNIEIFSPNTPENRSIVEDEEKEIYAYIIDSLKEDKVAATFAFAEIEIIGVIAVLVIYYFALLCAKKIFANILKEKTPFTKGNALYIRKIAYFMLTNYAVIFGISLVLGFIFKYDFSIDLPIITLPAIIVLFALSHVFEYGYGLQKNTKSTIFGDE